MYIIVAGVNKSFGDNLSIIIHLSGAETWSSEPRQSRNGVIEGGCFCGVVAAPIPELGF